MQRQHTSAVNEVIASILIVALVIILAVIIGGIVFGLIVIQPKSAYIPPEVKVVSYPNGTPQAISLYSRGGDMAVLDSKGGANYALGIYVDTPTLSYAAIPDGGVRTFNPGQTLFIYWNGSAYRITDNLEIIGSVLPNGQLILRIVDENAKLLVYNQGMTISGGMTASPTPTCNLGTYWRIRNQYNADLHYRLEIDPGGLVISQGPIPKKKEIHLWYAMLSPYKAKLTTTESGRSSGSKNAGPPTCQFTTYQQDSPGQADPQLPQGYELQLSPL